ncbi:RUS1 family protein [bacterium]|nr:RUS1 family protein [bacterium]
MLIQQARPAIAPRTLTGASFLAIRSASRRPEEQDQFTETFQGRSVVYGYDAQGQLRVQGGDGKNPGQRSLLDRARAMGKRVIFPPNVETSVSKDYMATRAWHAAHYFVHGVGGFVVGAATAAALAGDATWGAAVGGGAAMASFGLIRNYACNATGFLTSFQVDKAEKNPRGWMIAGEALHNLGMAVGALTAVPSVTAHVPGGLFSLTMAGAALSTIGGVMKGAAEANVNQRQAVDGNLAQLNIANSHQDMFNGILAGAGGAALMAGIHQAHLGAAAVPAVAAVTGILGTIALTQWVKNLDYNPVTESALRRVLSAPDSDSKLLGPKPDKILDLMRTLGEEGKYTLGGDQRPLSLERSHELKALFQGRNYMLDIQNGKAYIMMRENCSLEDRCQAVYQAIQLEKLQADPKFANASEMELVRASLERTPLDIKPFLKQMKEAGWSTDIVKFSDTGRRLRW